MARHRASVARHTLKVMLVTSTDMAAISGFWDVDMSMHSWENVGYIWLYGFNLSVSLLKCVKVCSYAL